MSSRFLSVPPSFSVSQEFVALRDSLFIIAHILSFVNPFSKNFLKFFWGFYYRTDVRFSNCALPNRFAFASAFCFSLAQLFFTAPALPLLAASVPFLLFQLLSFHSREFLSLNSYSIFPSVSSGFPQLPFFLGSSWFSMCSCAPLSRGDLFILAYFAPNVKPFSQKKSHSAF